MFNSIESTRTNPIAEIPAKPTPADYTGITKVIIDGLGVSLPFIVVIIIIVWIQNHWHYKTIELLIQKRE